MAAEPRVRGVAVALSVAVALIGQDAVAQTTRADEARRRLGAIRAEVKKRARHVDALGEREGALRATLAAIERDLTQTRRKRGRLEARLQELDTQGQRLAEELGAARMEEEERRDDLARLVRRRYVMAAAARLHGGISPMTEQDAWRLALVETLAARAAEGVRSAERREGALEITADRVSAHAEEARGRARTVAAVAATMADRRTRHSADLKVVAAEKARDMQRVAALEREAADLERLIRDLRRRQMRAAARARVEQAPATPIPPLAPRERDTPDPAGNDFAAQKGRLPSPLLGPLLRPFGRYRDSQSGTKLFSPGVLIGAGAGALVRAVYAGTVMYAQPLRAYGHVIVLDHGDGYYTVYGHAAPALVSAGARVARGEPIARVGTRADEGETALYFEVRHRGAPVDPRAWVPALGLAAAQEG